MPNNWRPTEWSDPSGLRRVMSNGEAGNDNWPSASDQRKVKDGGIVNFSADADVTTLESIPMSNHQPWDDNFPGPGFVGPAQDGPAVAQLRKEHK